MTFKSIRKFVVLLFSIAFLITSAGCDKMECGDPCDVDEDCSDEHICSYDDGICVDPETLSCPDDSDDEA